MWAHGEKSGHGEHCGPMERRVDTVSIVGHGEKSGHGEHCGPMERRVDTVSIVGPWREEWTW